MSQQSSSQTLVFGAGDCVLWLDPSVTSSLTTPITPDHITQITDQALSVTYIYASQANTLSSTSPTPTQDTTSFLSDGLVLKNGYFWGTATAQLGDSQGRFSLFYVGGYNAHTTDERKTWLFVNEAANAGTHYPPGPTNAGGILLTRMVGTPNTFTLTFTDATGHSTVSEPFIIADNAFAMSIIVDVNGSAYPTILVRINGQQIWTYDAGTLNPDGLSFQNVTMTSTGAGLGPDYGLDAAGEIIAFQGPLVTGTMTQIESYLQTKWVPTLESLTMGSLSTLAGVVDETFTAIIAIANAASVSVTTVATNVGSNWQAIAPSDGTNNWTITGLFPPTQTNFALVVTAMDVTGTKTLSQTFQLTTTITGIPSALQQLVEAQDPVLWLDPSDSTTVTTSNGRVTYLYDKASTAGFTLASSETPSLNSSQLNVPGLGFAKTTESASGFNYALTLDPATRPDLFGNSLTPFASAPVAANTPMGNGLVVSSSNGSFTLVMVMVPDGQVGGTPAADLTFQNDFPPSALNYCVAKWGVSTTNLGTQAATVWMSDAVTDATVINTGQPATPNRLQATTTLAVNKPAIVVWRYDPTNGPVVRINGGAVSTAYTHGSGSNWSTALQRLTQIGGAHSLGTLGEIIAFASSLPDQTVAQLETLLRNKWFEVIGTAPTISVPTVSQQYATNNYAATVTISNGGLNPITASISASAGSNWTITQDQTTATLFHIAGVMPATAGQVLLSISAEQDNAVASTQYQITALPLPTAPVIQTLTALVAPKLASYSANITILNAHNNDNSLAVGVSATQGSNWTIVPDPSHTPNLYLITGTMPATLTEFNLTVTANDQSGDSLANNTVTRVFQLQTTGNATLLTPQYPLDLTGMLPSNLISGETQTLTLVNGPNGQFLVPILAPFFGPSLVLQYVNQSGQMVTAQPSIDYQPVCELQTLSRATVSPLYTAVYVFNKAITGTVTLRYQTLGGNFTINRQALYNSLSDRIVNERELDWSLVVNVPPFFPVAPHQHAPDTDLVGTTPLLTALTNIQTAYLTKAQSKDLNDIVTHIANHNNPHQMNAALIGLGNVPNYPPATDAQAQSLTNTTTLCTPHSAGVVAQAGIGQATTTQRGIMALNEGNTAGDDNNATDGITAAGILALMTASGTNQIKTTFLSGEQQGQITPYPITFPIYWHGVSYNSLTALLYAIETYVGIQPLPFNQNTGVLYFPKNVTIPDLTVSATSQATGTRNFTTADNTSLPLLVPTGTTF